MAHSLSGSMVTGSECRPPGSTTTSGGISNSKEWALCLLSGLGWTGPGLASARWIRMCRGMDGGWIGGSVVGLGGSTAIRGGDGGIWEGGGETTVAIELGYLLSSGWEGGRLGEELLAGGSVWLDEVSAELHLVTGVILAGGIGGERFVETGFETTRGGGASAKMMQRQIK